MHFQDVFPLNEKGLPRGPWSKPRNPPYVPAQGETYGLPTGKRNGFFAIDLDVKGGKDGIEALSKYIVDKDIEDLPDTYTVRTKSGGMHYYFSLPSDREVRNRVGVLEGVDVRGEGGFVRAGYGYEIETSTAPAPAPQWLLDLVCSPKDAAPIISPVAIDPNHAEWSHRIGAATQYLTDQPPCIDGQGGQNQLYSIACTLVRNLELPIDTCVELLQSYNERCQPPWSPQEIMHKLQDAATKETGITGTFLKDFCATPKPPPTPVVMGGPVSDWRQKKNPDHIYTFNMAQDIAGTIKENPLSQRDLTSSMTGPAATPDWRGVWQFDLFTNRIVAVNPPLALKAETDGFLSIDIINTRLWYTCKGFKVTIPMIEEAIRAAASAASCHCVREYLHNLPPVESLHLKSASTAEFLFGSTPQEAPHVIDFLRRWMIGCVARVMVPGSQFDTVLTLLGQGGWHKSTFFKRLAVDQDWYRGNAPAIADPQKVGLAMRGHWIVELGELTTMKSAQREAFLEFITRTEEKFRAPYERAEVSERRQCGIGATSNSNEFLSALDGAIRRRFLPIHVRKMIDTDWVTEHRDELWAEAYAAYQAGESWWVEDESSLDGMKSDFTEMTPIEEKLSVYMESNKNREYLNGKSATQIYEIVFCDPQRPSLPTPGQKQEIGRFMKRCPGVKAGRVGDRRFYGVDPLPEDPNAKSTGGSGFFQKS